MSSGRYEVVEYDITGMVKSKETGKPELKVIGKRRFHLLLDQQEGSGTFGEVYNAIEVFPEKVRESEKRRLKTPEEHKATLPPMKKYIIKRFKKDSGVDVENLSHEVSFAQQNNFDVLGPIVRNNSLYIVMERAPGLPLINLHGKIHPALAQLTLIDRIRIIKDLFIIFVSMHNLTMRGDETIHHDVKCENIMLDIDESQQLKIKVNLIDYGSSTKANLADVNAQINVPARGSPDYLAPETALELASPKSDIYSLTSVCLVILGATDPFVERRELYTRSGGYTPTYIEHLQQGEGAYNYEGFLEDIHVREIGDINLKDILIAFVKRMESLDPNLRPSSDEGQLFFLAVGIILTRFQRQNLTADDFESIYFETAKICLLTQGASISELTQVEDPDFRKFRAKPKDSHDLVITAYQHPEVFKDKDLMKFLLSETEEKFSIENRTVENLNAIVEFLKACEKELINHPALARLKSYVDPHRHTIEQLFKHKEVAKDGQLVHFLLSNQEVKDEEEKFTFKITDLTFPELKSTSDFLQDLDPKELTKPNSKLLMLQLDFNARILDSIFNTLEAETKKEWVCGIDINLINEKILFQLGEQANSLGEDRIAGLKQNNKNNLRIYLILNELQKDFTNPELQYIQLAKLILILQGYFSGDEKRNILRSEDVFNNIDKNPALCEAITKMYIDGSFSLDSLPFAIGDVRIGKEKLAEVDKIYYAKDPNRKFIDYALVIQHLCNLGEWNREHYLDAKPPEYIKHLGFYMLANQESLPPNQKNMEIQKEIFTRLLEPVNRDLQALQQMLEQKNNNGSAKGGLFGFGYSLQNKIDAIKLLVNVCTGQINLAQYFDKQNDKLRGALKDGKLAGKVAMFTGALDFIWKNKNSSSPKPKN
ncbi:MAG: hypothetical protein ABI597_00875 [Gammaproteobacteria bacterium]